MSRQRKKKKLKGAKPTKVRPFKEEEKGAPFDVERQKTEGTAEVAQIAEAPSAKEAAEVDLVEQLKAQPAMEVAHVSPEGQNAAAAQAEFAEKPFYKKYSGEILLAILAIYVILLGLATISELFDLGWFKFDWLIGR